MRLIPIAFLAAFATPALAQPAPQPQPFDFEGAISKQIGADRLACFKDHANLEMLSGQVAELNKELADARAKLAAGASKPVAPAPDAPKP